jgi:hypothetical protein
MSKITIADKTGILIFGIILAVAGIYGLRLELDGSYLEMGMLYLIWLPLQIPIYFIAKLTDAPTSVVYIMTFVYWFLLGSFITSIPLFLKNYFTEIFIN